MTYEERKLSIELVPSPLWGQSLHGTLKRSQWDTIRKAVYARQNHRCGICEAPGRLLCHEIWQYDDAHHVQTLTGFIAICDMCNNVKHLGRAGIVASEGKLDYSQVIAHYMRVNQCSREDFESDKTAAFDQWRRRSQYQDWAIETGDYTRLAEAAMVQDNLKTLLSTVDGFTTPSQYLHWLSYLNEVEFSIWKAWSGAEYFVRGAIEGEQRKRQIPVSDRKRPSQPHKEGWLYAERQQGEYPESTENNGKWMVFPSITEVDNIWFIIAEAIEQGKLGMAAKVATGRSYVPGKDTDDRVICVYTYDSEDKEDLLRILQQLRTIGIHHRAFYKEDRETHEGNYAGVNIWSHQPTTRSPVKYYARPGQVELMVPKSRTN